MKLRTQGLSPKLPVSAVTTLIVSALAYFGVDLDPEVSAAIGVVVGFAAGYFAPAAPVAVVPVEKGESGQGVVQALMIIALVLFIIALVVWLLAHH